MKIQDKIYLGLGVIFILYALVNFIDKPAPSVNQTNTPTEQPVKIIAVGDINLGRQTGQKILAGEIDYPFINIADYLKSADITFGNLESQLADLDGETQSPTNEYRFAGPPAGADSLNNAGFDIVSLANNHMWDYGKDRLFETMDNLDRTPIKYIGASRTTENLYHPVIMEVRNQKIAWFAVTAILNGYEKAGAKDYVAWADDDRLIEAIKQLRTPPAPPFTDGGMGGVDWIIVSMHRGVEYAATPSSTQIDFAHKVINAGANIVIGHHPHVPEGIENYNNGIIFYSLGNFAFWQPFDYWTQHSFAVEFTLKPDGTFDHTIVPINAGWQPKLSDEIDQTKIKEYLIKLSDKLNPAAAE
ncbi:MAG: CapA family protein [Patescibacteria group bacterium]|jgi:poly-gamma-glutamate synthesis protein (capsule biosynthesis protein)